MIRLVAVFSLSLLLVAFAVPASAAEEAGHEGETIAEESHGEGSQDSDSHQSESHQTETWLGVPMWVFGWINLAVFWGVLLKFLVPFLKTTLAERKASIATAQQHAAQQRVEAEQMHANLSQQIEELKNEVSELAARSEREGRREHEELLVLAEVERKRILEQARDEIENRMREARSELVAFTAQLAAQLATEKVASLLTAEDRRRLFDVNLTRLEERVS